MRFGVLFLLVATLATRAAEPDCLPKSDQPEALVLIMGDQHSAYERTAQFVALVDRLKADHPALPLAIVLNGDTLEYGNVIARRSSGAVDFAMFSALVRRAPTILNLGNHEPEFYDLADTIQRIETTGVRVVGNIINHATGKLFVPSSLQVKLGSVEATVVGITTDHLSTYRAAVRPSLDLANPVVWARQNLSTLLDAAPLPVVLSHAGLNADREILPLVPAGTLFAGAHDHLRFIYPMGRGSYVHSGSWNEYLTLAWLHRDSADLPFWKIEQIEIPTGGSADPILARMIHDTQQKYLRPEDTLLVGQSPAVMSPQKAARFVTRLLRASADVDAAFIGNTTFGAGLPGGAISRIEFDACVRFDGTLYAAEIDGVRLQALLADANQGVDEPFEKRRGEFLVAAGPERIDPKKQYRILTTDWGARNTASYFGSPSIQWRELAGPKLKARLIESISAP